MRGCRWRATSTTSSARWSRSRRACSSASARCRCRDIDLAIDELQRLAAEPGSAGVEVGGNINGVPIDRRLAAASVITGNLIVRRPTLRIAFSHGGGTLSSLLPRLQHAWHTLPPVRKAVPADPTSLARRMYFDDLVYDDAAIHRLIDVFGASQILVGSDYPFAVMDDDPAGRVESLALTAQDSAMLRSLNARRWLGLEST